VFQICQKIFIHLSRLEIVGVGMGQHLKNIKQEITEAFKNQQQTKQQLLL
jgi:hypothetical protein